MKVSSNLATQRVSSLFGDQLILGSFISKVMFIYLGFLNCQSDKKKVFTTDYKILFIFIINSCVILNLGAHFYWRVIYAIRSEYFINLVSINSKFESQKED